MSDPRDKLKKMLKEVEEQHPGELGKVLSFILSTQQTVQCSVCKRDAPLDSLGVWVKGFPVCGTCAIDIWSAVENPLRSLENGRRENEDENK